MGLTLGENIVSYNIYANYCHMVIEGNTVVGVGDDPIGVHFSKNIIGLSQLRRKMGKMRL